MLRSSSTPLLGSLLPSFSEKHPTSKLSSSNNGGFAKSLPHSPSHNQLRRVQSEGNFEELGNKVDDFKKAAHKPTLEPIPSFSYQEDEQMQKYLEVTRNVDDYSNMGKMYMATGIGVPASGGGAVDYGMEEHYKNMLEGSPGNPLFLRNYAHFLYQEKGDADGAEEYYSRAILADPEDGEVLCEYARLIWELHHDRERAAAYFERAVQTSSQDSHVHASYASFLWDIEEDEDDEKEDAANSSHPLQLGFMASATS